MESILDNLTKEEVKVLVDRYPFLKPYNVFSGELPDNYDYEYIFPLEIPVGWERMFLQMCEDIRQPLIDCDFLDKFRLVQCKEKFAELRVYHNGAPKKVCDIIAKYEQMSYYICSQCGKPAEYITSGWMIPLCGDCYDKLKNPKCEKIEFQDYYFNSTWRDGKEIVEKISFKNEWDRYIKG